MRYRFESVHFSGWPRVISPGIAAKRALRLVVLGCLVCLLTALAGGQAQAHGAIVIDSGAIDPYAWTLSVSPYPLTPGPTNLSLLVFNSKVNTIVSNLQGEVYMAAPNSPEPCCKPGVHAGPFPLLMEPFQFAGDYIAYVPIDAVGLWTAQFQLKSPERAFAITSKMDVVADATYGPVNSAMIAEQVAQITQYTTAAMVKAAQASVALAYTSTATANTVSPLVSVLPTPPPSPLATPVETPTSQAGSAPPVAGGSSLGWVAGVIGVVVVGAGVGIFLMRRNARG